MKMEISDTKTVADLQRDFSTEFPFLKLEVCKTKYAKDVNSTAFHSPDRLLAACRKIHTEGFFSIDNTASIMEFEERMLQEYGLTVEVFRKCGKSWIATILSRSWSLQRQNNEGFETNSFDYP